MSLSFWFPLHRDAHQGDSLSLSPNTVEPTVGMSICSLFRDCPFFGGRNVWTIYRQGMNSLSTVGRLSTLQSVHYQRFHCIPTRYSCSLPPQACADKLKNELQQYGFPPVFPREVEEKEEEQESPDPADPTKRAKKVPCLVILLSPCIASHSTKDLEGPLISYLLISRKTKKVPCSVTFFYMEPPNNGHVGDEYFVHWSEVVPSSEVEMYGQYIGRG